MSGIIESRGEIVNWFCEFEPSVKFASGERKAICYAVRGTIDDLRMTPCELRKKFQVVGFANAETLVPQRGNPVTFPIGNCWQVGLNVSSAWNLEET